MLLSTFTKKTQVLIKSVTQFFLAYIEGVRMCYLVHWDWTENAPYY
jgi:hypothetical protein